MIKIGELKDTDRCRVLSLLDELRKWREVEKARRREDEEEGNSQRFKTFTALAAEDSR